MPRKGKRRKVLEDDVADSEPSNDVMTIADNVRTTNELFCFHEHVLLEWMDGRDDEDARSIIRLLKGLCDLLNHRWNTSTKRSILLEFARCMLKHGVPFHYVWGSHTSKFMAREEYCEKLSPTNNVDLFFRDLSNLEHRIRSSIWNFHNVYFGCTKTTTRVLGSLNGANISTLRDQLCLATRNLNYRAVVARLANSEVLRMTSEIIEKAREGLRMMTYNIQHLIYFDSPMAIWVALQATLSMKHDLSFNMGNRLLLLATMQSMIYTTTAARNTILMQLCEFLIAAILCGSSGDVSGIVALENSINRFNKSYENAVVWNAYKLIAEYEERRGRVGFGGMILNTAQSLLETAELMSYRGTLFVEAACRIWAKQGRCEEKISQAVSKVLRRCPQLLERMKKFLQSIDCDHEIDVAVEEVCNERESKLPPSDSSWLDWCQPRIERPERYGRRTEVLARCVNVLFRFLDYGSNRGSARAWVLLHTVVQLIDPAHIVGLWAERYDWWHRFHTVALPSEADLRRSELLAALAETSLD